MTDIEGRILNPVIVLTMVLSGLAYARVLWAVYLHPTSVLWIISTAPGAIYLITIGAIRSAQTGELSTFYFLLLLDWMIFATTAFLAVMVARRRKER